ncbi:ferredoxin [Actinomadura sp. NEAU-AAG7]|uniref:ferredoxin n=1 Tax=Actinomadura sp. NEAU-AAG7 TaxID=2839640 RepID=UPI001BE47127|nr:ferredoxin [Actinomadura sp. NEAU-AAG7]MBT2212477.1 ferredoxin [Actinomadura sp. NEAU-AAG7]
MRVRVDQGRCLGHGLCEALAGDVYQVTETGYNEMGEFEVVDALRDVARKGASACPERAIAVLGDEPAGQHDEPRAPRPRSTDR